MTFSFTSGPAFVLTFISVFGYALFIKAPFAEVWVALASLYGVHVGRRLWRQLKSPLLEMECEEEADDAQTK
jgi:hypothetical protein